MSFSMHRGSVLTAIEDILVMDWDLTSEFSTGEIEEMADNILDAIEKMVDVEYDED